MTEYRSPTEIDTRLAELYQDELRIRRDLAALADRAHRAVGDTRQKLRFTTGRWERSTSDVLATDPATLASYEQANFARIVAEHERAADALHAVAVEQGNLEAIYNANPWPRFFHVSNLNGHIHRTAPNHPDRCQTCKPDTPYRWLPALSGLTEDDAVKAIGPVLCSVCFPSAPVEHTTGVAHSTRQEREARQAERAQVRNAKDAKKLADALFEGEPARFIRTSHDRVATIRQARSFLKDGRVWQLNKDGKGDHPSYPQSKMDEVAEALAARLGVPLAEVWADVEKKAQAQHRKDAKEAAKFKAQYGL